MAGYRDHRDTLTRQASYGGDRPVGQRARAGRRAAPSPGNASRATRATQPACGRPPAASPSEYGGRGGLPTSAELVPV